VTAVAALSAPEQLLAAELETLVPRLRAASPADLERETVCQGWTVRDIVGHCAAALAGLTAGAAYQASHEQNQRDVEERRGWPVADVLGEFERGLIQAGPAIREAGGAKDLAALGTWIHGGDVRAALGWPDAYQSAGTGPALEVLAQCRRVTGTPLVIVTMPDRELVLGTPRDGRAPGRLAAAAGIVFQLYSGRPADAGRYRLSGAQPGELASAEW
jgi:uncharacterized protein (TIGR03083 family)